MPAAVSALSYAHGASATPLLGETIGANLARTVAAHGGREALVVRHQDVPLDLRRARRARRRRRARAARGRARAGRPGRDLGAELRRVGARPVRDREGRARSSSTSTRPTARSELEYVLRPVGLPRCWSRRTAFKSSDYAAMVERGARRLPGARARRAARTRRAGTSCSRAPTRSPRTSCATRAAALQFDDPINIQYTSGTTGFPKGATLSHHNILNNGFFVGEALRLHAGRPGLHPGAVLPLLRHGDGQPRRDVRTAPAWSSPAPAFEPRGVARGGRRRSAARRSTACRRCSSPSSTTRTSRDFDLSSLRTGIMAGSPCPVEVMQQVHRPHAHARGDDLLRHDRDLAGVDADRRRRRRRAPHRRRSGACTRTSRSRSSTRRPGARVPRGEPGELCTRGYSRDARLLGRRRSDRARRSTPPAGCTPATSRRWTTTATSTSSAARRT